MYNSVIVGYSRSPFTMARKGDLIDIKPVNLLSEVINKNRQYLNFNVLYLYHYNHIYLQYYLKYIDYDL